MKHQEVRDHLRGIVWELTPKLATSVLDRRDYEYSHELATRIDAALELVKRFDEAAKEQPGADGLVLLKGLESKMALERATAPEAQRGPSIWELIQKPAL